MKELLFEFENCLESHGVQSINGLQVGYNKKYVSEFFKNIGIENHELLDLYGWRNGVSNDDMQNKNINELELFPYGIILSLENAIDSYLLYTTKLNLWGKSLYPIFTSGGGDYLLMDTNKTNRYFHKIYIFSSSLFLSNQIKIIYDSIETLFRSVITCYKKGVYKIDIDGISINVDYDQEQELSKSLNPRSDYWLK